MNLRFVLSSIIVVLIQAVTGNFFWYFHVVSICLLPSVILSVPTRVSTPATLVFAFVISLLCDFLCDGNLGLSAAALLPVAAAKRSIVAAVFGRDVIIRSENINMKRHGVFKTLLGLILVTALYLVVFIWIDGAGMRSFLFNIERFLLSLTASVPFGLVVFNALSSEREIRWR